ncbi:ribosome biogenesis GTPase Der [Mahella australiensis]|uniref:GTPase Der n=1 Tax=Mahella australiensis (strain DSM 15567 / CIP 107919 / 50-1 BON) TaxID=697281 RepID=F4A1B3_MAHA5|nr:ribosome biogenesis GTPase Der [Mahella australiensis]AEE97032.1 ribosome-associated GTPase EngA [Mahella australiensis 50-1 BON]
MDKATVAIIGRPNVGKSTLFNRLVGRRISIVDDTPGITRDRIYADVEWTGKIFSLVDTGGIDFSGKDSIVNQMIRQAQYAIDTADVILLVVDANEGMTSADEEVADILRRSNKSVLLVCNKVDNFNRKDLLYDFYKLGLGDPIPISAGNGLGIGDLLDKIVAHINVSVDIIDEETIRIAVIGKPNAGKSSIVNRLLGQERVIVSDQPGTTRDAIDVLIEHEGDRYILIDTAGLRRKAKINEAVERYSVSRALEAVQRSDVAALVIDAVEGVTEQDAKIAGFAHEKGKGLIVLLNKWDLIEKDNKTVSRYKQDIAEKLGFIGYAPVLFISAKTGQRMDKILPMVKYVFEQSSMRISTGVLNDVIREAVAISAPPSSKGRSLKIYYATQVAVRPPTFVLFVNDTELMHFSYERYLENYLRRNFGFEGTPIRIAVRARKE